MSDAFKRLQQQKARQEEERQKAEAYSRVMEQGLSDYARAVEHKTALEGTLRFAISDPDVLQSALDDLQAAWDALNECVPQAIRVEFEARRVTRNEEVTGGRVM